MALRSNVSVQPCWLKEGEMNLISAGQRRKLSPTSSPRSTSSTRDFSRPKVFVSIIAQPMPAAPAPTTSTSTSADSTCSGGAGGGSCRRNVDTTSSSPCVLRHVGSSFFASSYAVRTLSYDPRSDSGSSPVSKNVMLMFSSACVISARPRVRAARARVGRVGSRLSRILCAVVVPLLHQFLRDVHARLRNAHFGNASHGCCCKKTIFYEETGSKNSLPASHENSS
mmetsp:Transcript_10252/g.20605  ORF Transcript_10252/g.20605 Transcript_10252/m.20605 type:complete len:225 (+) Transcript_10252:707-1381(+)